MWITQLSAFFARYRGLLVLIAIALVIVNFGLRFFDLGWLSSSDLFLHLGVIVGLLGLLLAEALG